MSFEQCAQRLLKKWLNLRIRVVGRLCESAIPSRMPPLRRSGLQLDGWNVSFSTASSDVTVTLLEASWRLVVSGIRSCALSVQSAL